MKRSGFVVVCALGLALGGCATFGSNINGSFRCDAPDGICAPSSVIDDTAISRIEETSSADLLNPAGPYEMDDGIAAPVRGSSLAQASSVPAPAPTYRLSVVFPGYTDAFGEAHSRRIVETDVQLPGRAGVLSSLAARGASRDRNRGLLAAAESAPPYLAVAPKSGRPPLVAGSAAEPSAPEVAAVGVPSVMKRIEARVEAALSHGEERPKREASSFSGVVE